MDIHNHLFDEDQRIRVLDLFSAAAGGWSLGMHRAGYHTIAACEVIDWRRALYSENNPGVHVYDDVTTLTADRLVRDGHGLPDIIVGSPPCQDISSANTKGKGVDGERSSLYFEAVRLIDECRPRWFALENSANLRTRGADRVIDALAAIGYTCWPFVVSAGDVGANHERKRSWLVGVNVDQVAYASGWELGEQSWWRHGADWPNQALDGDDDQAEHAGHPTQDGRGQGWSRGRVEPIEGLPVEACGYADTKEIGCAPWAGDQQGDGRQDNGRVAGNDNGDGRAPIGNPADTDEAGQEDGRLEPSLRPPQEPDDGCGDGWSNDGQGFGQMGGGTCAGEPAAEPWADWNGGLAHHLRVDDGLSGWVAQSRIAVGGPRGTVAASLIVEAFGDAVCPQIPEAIGRAILRVERALAAVANDNYPSTVIPAALSRSHA